MNDYNYIDLFSGIGGFALGAYWADMRFKNHFASEIDKYCIELYQKRFPDSIQLGNITKIDTQELIKKYGDKWILSGGFPCQDISIAGKGEGITGSRSGLWFEYWRLIRDLRPRFAIMENVGAITFRGLTELLGSLAEIGYNAEWQDIRAEDVGAPHKRERIWIVAYTDTILYKRELDTRRNQESTKKSKDRDARKGKTSHRKRIRIKSCTSGEDVADTNSPGLQAQRPEQQTTGIARSYSQGKISDTNCIRLQGLTNRRNIDKKNELFKGGEIIRTYNAGTITNSDNNQATRQRKYSREIFSKSETKRFNLCSSQEWWSTEPSVGRLANGIPRRVDRLKGLGNAIVPQIACMLFERIKLL